MKNPIAEQSVASSAPLSATADLEQLSQSHYRHGAIVAQRTSIAIDLAKQVFQLHGVDAFGKAVVRRQVKRSELPVRTETLANGTGPSKFRSAH